MNDQPLNRRNLLREAGRLALAGGMLAAMGFLAARKPGESEDCVKAIACGACSSSGNCELPRAAIWRDSKSKLSLKIVEGEGHAG